MREAASRGFFLGSKAPFGYKRVKVNDGVKERPKLEVDPATAPRGEGGIRELASGQRPRGTTSLAGEAASRSGRWSAPQPSTPSQRPCQGRPDPWAGS